jgi:hypothetical protein
VAVSAAFAGRLVDALDADLQRDARLGLVRRYLKGDHDLPYMPKGAKAEFRHMAEKSVTNWLPLLSDTYAKGLFVDGYRPAKATDNARPWSYWQANGLDARQSVAHRGALEYGTSYVLVRRSTGPVPLIRPLSPLRSLAWYEDEDDDWPELGLVAKGRRGDTRLFEVYQGGEVFTVEKPKDGDLVVSAGVEHGLGRVPLVRFRDRLDGEATGIIRPARILQDRVNEVVFATMIALQYASHRQRWATGLAIPVDDAGNPVEPFQAAVNRLWVSDDPEVRFGEFAQTELSGHHATYDSTVRTLAATAQISPNILTGDLINLSADALAQMEAATQRKIAEFETLFGESWENVFRLAALAAGDAEAAADTSSQVRWRDTEARSLAQAVDAWGKAAQMLGIPPEELWEKIPGVTDQDVERWKEAAGKADGMALLAAELQRQASAAAAAAEPAPTEIPAA